jgi:integrase
MGCIYRHKNRPTWWIKWKAAGRWQYATSGSERREDAVRLLRLKEGDVAKGLPVTSKVGRLRFEEAVTDLENYHESLGRNTKKMKRRIAMHLAPYFGNRKMADITASDARAYMALRKKEGAKQATINRELGLLKQMFNLAVPDKLLTKPKITLPNENNARQGFLEHDQYRAVLRHLPEELRGVVTLAFYSGWRMKSEILKLQWRQVERTIGQIRLDPGTTKNKEGRMLPYGRVPELKAVIDAAWAEHERLLKDERRWVPCVFHRDGRQIRSMLKAFKAACKAAGCPGRIPHDLRRTAVRNLERAGVPRSQAMQITGHQTESVYRRYAIVSETDLNDAADRMAVFTSVFTSKEKTG